MPRSGVYFNEWEPYAAAWLRSLYPRAVVDERSIADVSGLGRYERVHLFAGIGGWEYALELAGWPRGVRVWTGSCPCQDFSISGKQAGYEGERDLWPEMRCLVAESRPEFVFGEQVENAIRHGWLDRLCKDLESEGYACGAHVLGSHSVGANHVRQRLYFAAYLVGFGDKGLLSGARAGAVGQGRQNCKEDLRRIYDAPFEPGDSHPQPLIRKMDDGFSTRVGRTRAYGNAIMPQVAAMFITAFMQSWEELKCRR